MKGLVGIGPVWKSCSPLTKHFTILMPRNQAIGEFYVAEKRQSTDFEARKLGSVWTGLSGGHEALKGNREEGAKRM